MRTINYIKTIDINNMKIIRKHQESIAYMVDDAIVDFFEHKELKKTDSHIWVEKYLLVDIRLVYSYKNNSEQVNVEGKVKWLDTTKSYRIEVVINNENVFVSTLSLAEGESLEADYRKFDSHSELAKEFKQVMYDWLKSKM